MSIDHYLNHYPALAAQLPGQAVSWLQALRQNGFDRFAERGFPGLRDEEWRYTNLAGLNKTAFNVSASSAFDADFLNAYRLSDAYCLLLVNGRLLLDASDTPPAAVTVKSLAQALHDQPEQLHAYLGQAVDNQEHNLIAFNNAWFADGLWLEVAAGQIVDKPIQIIHLVTAEDALAVSRNLVVVNQQAEAEIIETFIGSSERYFTAAVSECFVLPNASLAWSKLQLEAGKALHFGGCYVQQARDSRFKHQNFALGSVLARSDIHSDLQQAAECQLDGLYVAGQRQHLDNHTRINHLAPHGVSREFYKGVLDDKARAVFQGRVVVAKDAQQTDSEMNNRNLLLSADAEVDSKPQLEIYADDVKCSHGMTVGQLDEKSLFYLQSRAIDEESARNLLTFAFANEMVEKVAHAGFKALLHRELLQRFPAISL